MKLIAGESYLSGTNIIKVIVALNDQSVWALSDAGVVYYKDLTATDFRVYSKTAGLVVKDLAGFNEAEMFFLAGPDIIYHYQNGVEKQIKAVDAGVTRINGIAAMNTKKSSAYYDNNPSIQNYDWIAVATNKHLYRIIRGEAAITVQYPYSNQPIASEPNWEITHTGFKTTDFRYRYPNGRCFNSNYNFLSDVQGKYYAYESEIPDGGRFPSKINCSLLSHQLNNPYIVGSDWSFLYNFWGTDIGLYVKEWNQCNQIPKLLLSGEVVNGLEEIYSLTPIYKQDFLCVATNRGLFYTPASIFDEANGFTNLNRVTFTSVPLYNGLKINSLYAQTAKGPSINQSSGSVYTSMCEKVIWSATADGLKKSYVILDQNYYERILIRDFVYSTSPSDFAAPDYNLCGENSVTVTYRIPEVFNGQILIQWYKNDREVTDWIGKRSVILKDSGIYYTKVTALCENIFSKSVPITIKKMVRPEVTFNYPAEINLCENQTYTFGTLSKPEYTYKWFKDDVEISGARQAAYTASTLGTYRVEVSNCSGSFVSSSASKINVLPISAPSIIANQRNYCEGALAILTVSNPSSYKIKWYYEGVELAEFENKNQITIGKIGDYKATFENANSCVKSSSNFRYFTETAPQVVISRTSNKALCFGETVSLQANSTDAVSYLWNTGETSKSITASTSGSYNVQVFNQYGCSQKSNQETVVINNPLIPINIPDTTICAFSGQQILITAPKGYAYYSWNGLRQTSNELMVNTVGTYELIIEDTFGCTASSTFIVAPYCEEVILPNTFTPNNDGVNDLLTIGGLDNDQKTAVFIFNRDGIEIYRSLGYYQPWDGKYKGIDVPAGIYYYVIKSNKTPKPLSGAITIIR